MSISEVIWKVNGTPVDKLGISVAGGQYRTQGVSYALLDAARGYDQTPLFGYESTVVISRLEGTTETKIFQGKVAPPAKHARHEYEGHDYPIEDAWAELETTTYQESWGKGAGTVILPKAVLGLDDTGIPISVGQQIRAIVTYAASVGVSLQMGTSPSGENLWPEEVNNISCAEAINKCLDFHPDWIPWIDHTTTPPTLNVTAVGSMQTVTIPVAGGIVESFKEIDRADLRPDGVRIIYEFATTIDNEVYRNTVEQKYPSTCPVGGPKVIVATIPLAGGQMQMQKSRVRVRPMPKTGDTNTLAKKWVKANYPQLKDADLEDFSISDLEVELFEDDTDDNPHPEEINERALRLVPTNSDQIPNQLLEGTIEDWMRKRVGWVSFSVKVKAESGASSEVRAAIAKGFPPGRTVATNALSKIYKGVTQWAAPEDVPEGIAQGVYLAMHAAYKHEGRVNLSTGELTGIRYHGKKITLTGAATNGSVIHSVGWDIPTGKTIIEYGPVPQLAPADFLEQQIRIRGRKVTWWSKDERGSNKLGSEKKPSAAGDTVSGYNYSQTIFEAGTGIGASKPGPLEPTTERPAHIEAVSGSPSGSALRIWINFGTINSRVATNLTDKFDISGAKDLYAEISFTTTGAFAVTSWKIVEKAPSFEPPEITTPRPDKGYYHLGSVLMVDGEPVLQSSGSGSISVWPQMSNSLTGTTADSVIVYSRH